MSDSNNEKFDLIFIATRQVFYEHDIATGMMEWEGQLESVLGYQLSEMVGGVELWEQLIHPDDRPEVLRRLAAAKKRVSTYELEYRFQRKGGDYLWMRDRGIFQSDKKGKAGCRLGVLEDITERKRVETELIQFRFALERSTDAVFMTDVQGKIWYVNPSFEKIYEYTSQEAVGQNPRIIKSGLIPQEQYVHFWDALLNKQVVAGEIVNKSKSGRLVPIEGSNTPVIDTTGQIIGFMATHRDITERKETQARIEALVMERTAELQESQQRLSLLIQQSPLAVIEWNTDFEVVSWNPAAENIFGYRFDEARGRHAAGLVVPATVRPIVNQEWQDLLAQKDGARSTNENLTKDGRKIICEWYNTPLVDSSGNIIGVSSLVADITERKRAEEELQAAEERQRQILDSSPTAMLITRLDGIILYANKRLAELLGLEANNLVGLKIPDFYADPAERQFVMEKVHQQGYLNDYEMRARKADGSLAWALLSLRLFKFGSETVFLSSLIDISERKGLEQRVQQSLERRGRQVQLTTQVAQAMATASSLEDLYGRVVTQVKEQFGYYHTQILRYEPAVNAVVLVNGYGETGARMLADGYRLPMGIGLIGTAAATGQTVLRPDLANAPDWQPNPLLPETRGEIAVPIKWGDRVLGVLDIQSAETGVLVADDQLLLEGLCGQIAIAVEDTRLRQEMAERLKELDTLYRAASREGWQTVQETGLLPTGYHFDRTDVEPISESWTAGQTTSAQVTNSADKVRPSVAVTPLTVRGGEVIGSLGVVDDPQRPLTDEDRQLVEQISIQVALALESARLFAQTQISLAETQESEQLVRTIVDSTPDWIFVKDLEHRFRMVNQAYADSLHLKTEDVIGKDDLELGFPEELVKGDPEKGIAGFWTDDQAVIERGEPKSVPNDLVMLEGNMHIFSTYKAPLRDAEGKIWGVLGVSRDVTERERVQQAIAQRARELSQVAELGTTISSILDPVQMLQTVVDLTKDSFSLYHAHIYLLSERGDVLTLAAGAGEVGRQMVAQGWKIPIDREHSLVARVARTRQGIITNDVRAEPDFMPNELLPETHSEMAVPLLVGDRVLGVLDVQSVEGNRFTEEDLSIHAVLASQVAVALQNARTYAQTQRQGEYEALINAISQRIQSTTTVENALQVAVRELGRALGASRASVQLGLTRPKK